MILEMNMYDDTYQILTEKAELQDWWIFNLFGDYAILKLIFLL